MNQPLFIENEKFLFTKPSLVLYVEDTYNVDINTFIQTNYQQIVEYYTVKEIDFCYLPYLFQNKNYQAIVNYNRPYLPNAIDNNSITEIYLKIKSQLTKPLDGAGLVLINQELYDSKFIIGYTLDEKKVLIEEFHKFANAIYEVFTEENIITDTVPQFKRFIPKESVISEPQFMIVDDRVRDADDNFGFDAYRLADEIRTRIQLLKESGSLSLIGDILEEIQGATKKLSTVFITNDYRIFLKDYDMKEIVMAPLPKSLYILFIRHPEGILFKQLSNYHDELLSIYRNVTVHENIDRAIESIRAMTDPLNNSINEKCSRIRAAFLEVIADDLAQNYYVTGYRGEPKKIIIDRSLVEFQ